MLEIDAVAGADPGQHLADAAQAYCEARSCCPIPGMRHREQRHFAIERPDQPPGLGDRIAEDFAVGGILSPIGICTQAGGIEPPIVIGAADLPLDALTDRQIGAKTRAPGTLHNRPARSIAIRDNAVPRKSTPMCLSRKTG